MRMLAAVVGIVLAAAAPLRGNGNGDQRNDGVAAGLFRWVRRSLVRLTQTNTLFRCVSRVITRRPDPFLRTEATDHLVF